MTLPGGKATGGSGEKKSCLIIARYRRDLSSAPFDVTRKQGKHPLEIKFRGKDEGGFVLGAKYARGINITYYSEIVLS